MIRVRDWLCNKVIEMNKDFVWFVYRKVWNLVNNMKKYVILNYYDNIEMYLDDLSKNNIKLYWKLMKDLFYMKFLMELLFI